jgi:hypothetical protein
MAPGRGVPGNPGPSSSSLNPHSSEAATKSSAVSGGGTSSGAQGAQMSESSKHPYDPGPGTTDIPRGALKDPAAGPNSRPEMEASVASGGASGSESGSGTSSPSAGAAGSTSAGPGVGTGPNLSSSGAANSGSESTTTTASTATPPSAADLDHARDPVRGPSSMPAAATSDDVRDPVRGPSSSPHPAATPPPVEETEPEPAPSPLTASPRSRHPFDTYAFVSRLEKSDIDSGSARALMEGVRRLIVSRSDEARGTMLSTEEMDNVSHILSLNSLRGVVLFRLPLAFVLCITSSDGRPRTASKQPFLNSGQNNPSAHATTGWRCAPPRAQCVARSMRLSSR